MTQVPTGDPLPPTLRRELDQIKADLRALHQRVSPEPGAFIEEKEVVFSHPTTPVAGEVSPQYRIRWPEAMVTHLSVTAEATGTGPTTIQLIVKKWTGSAYTSHAEAEVTLGAGDDYAEADDLMIPVEEWDKLNVKATAVGGTPAGFTARVVLERGGA